MMFFLADDKYYKGFGQFVECELNDSDSVATFIQNIEEFTMLNPPPDCPSLIDIARVLSERVPAIPETYVLSELWKSCPSLEGVGVGWGVRGASSGGYDVEQMMRQRVFRDPYIVRCLQKTSTVSSNGNGPRSPLQYDKYVY